jgi:nitrite reductase (NADH) large subunit
VKVLIIGNGVAGITVARELRARDEELEIRVLARESYDYYSRIRLPEVFGGGRLAAELLALYKPSWYAERRIEVSLARDALAIDRETHRVMLSSGEELGYDALVLALGSDPIRPSVPGASLPGVFTVREYDDAERVRASVLAHPESAAVVGGGLLGLEAARHLQLLGTARVTVLELAPRLLPRQLDQGAATILEGLLAGLGVSVLTGAVLSAFEGRDRLDGLSFSSGREKRAVPAGTAVVSMGVRPRLGLAKAAGLATGRGIRVDRFLRTSDPSIYAVGDCAEFGGSVPGIIPAALEQAPCCAAALLGDEAMPYGGTVPSNTLKVAGIDLFSAGIVDYAGGEGIEEIRLEPGEGRYERYLLKEGVLAGAIVLGSKERSRRIQPSVGKPMTRPELEALMSG